MVKALEKRFIFSSMVAISLLIFILLGTINIVNGVMTSKDTTQKLFLIANNTDISIPEELQKNNIDNEDKDKPKKNNIDNEDSEMPQPKETDFNGAKNKNDTFLSSNFFYVTFDNDGNITKTDVTRTTAVAEDDANALAQEVYDSNKETGKNGKYRYAFSRKSPDGSVSIVFLDTSDEIFAFLRVLLLSVCIGTVCWLLMLLLIKLLSNKAIKPIAENIEKQRQFVTNAGHEIKTPLAIILSNTEALELFSGESKWSKNIKTQTDRLSALTKNLLTLAKADEMTSKTIFETINLSEITKDTVSQFKERFEEKNISFYEDIEENISLKADKENIVQVISLLCDNCTKYTQESGTASVVLKKENSKIKLTIENTCESLPDTDPERLFERFYRADEARNQQSGGCGIGLSAARALTEINGGTLKCSYKGDNIIVFSAEFKVNKY